MDRDQPKNANEYKISGKEGAADSNLFGHPKSLASEQVYAKSPRGHHVPFSTG